MSSYYGDRSRDVPSWESLEVGDDDEVVDTSEYQYASRDHILFCVDASSFMQTPYPDQENPEGTVRGRSALHQVFQAIAEIERRKVITGPADSCGVLVYNVDAEKSPSSSSGNYKPGTHVYQALRTINAEEIKRIIKLVEVAEQEYQDMEEDGENIQPATLGEHFPACKKGDELNIADVLVTCNFLFRDAGQKLAGNKRVFLVTDQDEPPGSGSNREPARTVYGDLLTYGITINTYFVDRPGHRFNPTLYWNDILSREPDEDAPTDDTDPGAEGLAKLTDSMNELVIKHAPKRVQFTIPLKMGGRNGDIEIGVSGYALVSSQGKGQPKYVRMRGQAVEEVLTKTEYTSAETGAVLKREEIGQAFQFGHEASVRNVLEPNWWESSEHQAEAQAVADEALRLAQERAERAAEGEEDMDDDVKPTLTQVKVERDKQRVVARTRLQFTSEEVAQFRSMGLSPQIKILGFQSPQNLSVDENIKHSYFIYPNEDSYTGSTRTFAALLKSCIKLNRHVMALCRVKTNSTPEFCVLIPHEETFTSDGAQEDPPGFHVIVLPFADDLRQPPKNVTENLVATERQAKLMSNVVKRLRVKAGKYRSEVYPNPALAYHYAQLQALAFEEDFDLSTSIDEVDKTMPKYASMHKAAGEFMAEWNKSIEEDDRCVEVLRAPSKRAAATIDLDEEDLVDVIGAYKSGTIEKLKVQDLKDYAKYHRINIAGKTKKSDIIDAMRESLEAGGKKSKKG